MHVQLIYNYMIKFEWTIIFIPWHFAMFVCLFCKLFLYTFTFHNKWNFPETLSSVVAWPHFPNKVTLKCHTGNVVLQNYKDQCDFKPKCVLEYWNQSIIFFCSGEYTCTCMFNDIGIIFTCIYLKIVKLSNRYYKSGVL